MSLLNHRRFSYSSIFCSSQTKMVKSSKPVLYERVMLFWFQESFRSFLLLQASFAIRIANFNTLYLILCSVNKVRTDVVRKFDETVNLLIELISKYEKL